MFKQVCLLTRRPGMSMDEFKDYYENAHAPLLAPMMPGPPFVQLATASAYVALFVYIVGFLCSFFLPEPKSEALPE